ncbi:hypothetical protein ABT158_29445 [Nonomuraea sp. NPDC001636]|uniref:hypothetical protein n=1 Tax=Nonomuraea sp. NPDC001636 TaxID=3154391 RepID=UPI003322B497
MTAVGSARAASALERRYRRLLLAYPRTYRAAHGDELLDVLLESAAPGRRVPVPREAWGLLVGGVRSRIVHLASGSPWADGVHLAVTAVAAANLAALLPYAGTLPLWTLLSALTLLATARGWLRTAAALTLLTGAKAVALAGGWWQPFDTTLLPVYPTFLQVRPLFMDSDPYLVAGTYAVALAGLLALRRAPRTRSWWWWAAVVAASWAGPEWLEDSTTFPLSLSRLVVEAAAFGLAAGSAYLARDHRWTLAAAIYLATTSGELVLHSDALTRQHLAYWGVLALLVVGAAFAPFRRRRHCLD